MSHHLDTPLARQNGQLYIDDLYVFPGEESTVFIMDVNSTITGPDVQRGFAVRNGRTLADNAPEVMLSLVLDTAVPSGLTPSVSSRLRNKNFPYVMPA